MTWVKISDRKPEKDNRLITRSPGTNGKGDSIESWERYGGLTLLPPISHWWDGKYDFDKAIEEWYEDKETEEEA